MYIYTAKTGRVNDFLSMIASYTGNRAKGHNSVHIANELDGRNYQG